jgi:urease accessory protein
MQAASDNLSDFQRSGWQAELELRFALEGGRTVLRERRHRGPLQVQRAFYPEGTDLCHVYVLHPPGGLVAGDSLEVKVQVDAGARVLMTTPAAGKVYRGDGATVATQRQRLAVGAGASLEWLPSETIAFDGAAVELATRVDLDQQAAFVGWEILCLGRPAAGERFERGHCRQRLELWRAGRPLCLERASITGGGPVLDAGWGLRGAPVVGTLLATAGAFSMDDVRALGAMLPELTSATSIGEVLVCRYLGPSAERARAHFARVWNLVRPSAIGRPASAPRIWST